MKPCLSSIDWTFMLSVVLLAFLSIHSCDGFHVRYLSSTKTFTLRKTHPSFLLYNDDYIASKTSSSSESSESSLIRTVLYLHPDQGRDLEAYANEFFTKMRRDDEVNEQYYYKLKSARQQYFSQSSLSSSPSARASGTTTTGSSNNNLDESGPLAWCKKRVTKGWNRTTTASRVTISDINNNNNNNNNNNKLP